MSAAPAPSLGGDAAPRSVSRSHVGLRRAINEDRVFDCAALGLWAVADGMGGHRGGDLAAQAVVDEFRSLADARAALTAEDVDQAIQRANAAIVARNRLHGLDAGATVVVALLQGTTARIAWVGDSRAYRVQARFDPLTRDHSVVQELVAAGLLAPAMAERHPQANVVTRALGVADTVEIDWVVVELGAGERLMLCSDGLSRSLGEDARDAAAPLDQAADALLVGALHRDGSDNISLILIEPTD